MPPCPVPADSGTFIYRNFAQSPGNSFFCCLEGVAQCSCSFLPPYSLCVSCRLLVLQWSSLLSAPANFGISYSLSRACSSQGQVLLPIPPMGLTSPHLLKAYHKITKRSKTFNTPCHLHTSIHSTEKVIYYRKKKIYHTF